MTYQSDILPEGNVSTESVYPSLDESPIGWTN
jgi:hypothetical protein